ncbi:MAG TPA: SDR family oxidoreductase [Thermoleophilaceae bacterium]|jgi:NAD(P)-dependent dehydrogenase (short-subunit alcohol dehydrogenase family)|nr:SDR family oxidoreductase [Thermoleophilaceae bacterium]
MDLDGQVVIVTGASAGIGRATSRELARRGATVVVAARGVAALEEHARSIAAAGGEVLAVPTDVTDSDQVEHLVATTEETFGKVDVLVNNAGIGWTTLLVHSTPRSIRQIVDVNLIGAILTTRAVLPGMLERGRGAIVNVSSVCGRVAVEPLYCATKYGVRGFSLALRRQLAQTADGNISVSLVSPGPIRTNQTKDLDQRLPEPEVVAEAIARVIRRPQREVVVPRKHYAVVWLEQGLPSLADLAYRWRHRDGLRAH